MMKQISCGVQTAIPYQPLVGVGRTTLPSQQILMQHGGIMAGTAAHLKLMDNGIYYAFTVNKWDGSNSPSSDMRKAIEDAIKAISYWPSIDLF